MSLVNTIGRWFNNVGERTMIYSDLDPRDAMIAETKIARVEGIYSDGYGRYFVAKGAAYPSHWVYVEARETDPPSVSEPTPVPSGEALVVAGISGDYRDPDGTVFRVFAGANIPYTWELVAEYVGDDLPQTPSLSSYVIFDDAEFGKHFQRLRWDGVYADSAGNRYVGQKDATAPADWQIVGEVDDLPVDSDELYGRDIAPQAA